MDRLNPNIGQKDSDVIGRLQSELTSARSRIEELEKALSLAKENETGLLAMLDADAFRLGVVNMHLTALLEAVEPIKLRILDPFVGPEDNWIMVNREEIFNLASVVQKIKEGRGWDYQVDQSWK